MSRYPKEWPGVECECGVIAELTGGHVQFVPGRGRGRNWVTPSSGTNTASIAKGRSGITWRPIAIAWSHKDSQFIAHAREDIPYLLAIIDAARAFFDVYRGTELTKGPTGKRLGKDAGGIR